MKGKRRIDRKEENETRVKRTVVNDCITALVLSYRYKIVIIHFIVQTSLEFIIAGSNEGHYL